MRRVEPLLIPLLTLILWWVVAAAQLLPPSILPHPLHTWDQLRHGFTAGVFTSATGYTLTAAGAGCLIAATAGVPVGYGIARNERMSAIFGPVLAASQAIPAVALAPLLVVWIGLGTTPITILCTIIVIFPIIVTTAVGYRGVDRDIIDAAKLDGAGRWGLITRIETPLAAPAILAGLRTGFTLSITGAVVGEMVMGGKGLGSVLAASQGSSANVSLMFALIIVLATLAITVYLALSWVERRLDPERIPGEENASRTVSRGRTRGVFGWTNRHADGGAHLRP